jgi:DNA polymerase-3 subunit delta
MPVARTKAQAQVHAVVGSDEAEVKRAARSRATEMTPAAGGDFGTDIIDGVADNAEQATSRVHQTIDALLTFPFFGGEKLVWLKNANFLGETVTGRAQSVIDALDKLANTVRTGIPETTRFLLSATEIDKRRSFYKTLQKLAKVEIFDRLDSSKSGWEEEAASLVERAAATHRLNFSAEALEIFVLFTGGDRRLIESEVEKLDLYLGDAQRSVSAEHVRLLVPLSRNGVVFELGNALAERNLQRALTLLDQLLFQGETPIGIMFGAVIPTVRHLLLVKDLMARHKLARPAQPFFFGRTLERLPADALAHLPRKKDGSINPFGLGLAAVHVQRYKSSELREALAACLETNLQLVTSGADPRVAVSQLLARIIAGGSDSSGRDVVEARVDSARRAIFGAGC